MSSFMLPTSLSGFYRHATSRTLRTTPIPPNPVQITKPVDLQTNTTVQLVVVVVAVVEDILTLLICTLNVKFAIKMVTLL